MSDISKQIVYQRAIESTGRVDGAKLVNAFVFPSAATGREPYHSIRFLLPDGRAAPFFPPVLCQYVSVQDVVMAYAARRKLKDQTWLSDLCNTTPFTDSTVAEPVGSI